MTAPTPEQRKSGVAGLFDRLSDVYDAVGVEYFTVFGRRLTELTGVTAGEHVLDAGCGAGAATIAAADAVGPQGRVVAIDLAPGMVRRTVAAAERRGTTWVEVSVGDAEAPDVEGPFDVVLSSLVIFFLPDPMAALRAYHGLLREGGRLGLTTFPPQTESNWSDIGKVLERFVPQAAVTSRPDQGPLASPESLVAALKDVGYGAVRSETETYTTTFRNADQWWQWAWSQGQRMALERIPAESLDDVRAELYEIVNRDADLDGRIALRQGVTYTVAHR